MTTVGIREAKANLSRLLKHVQQGEEILITDHGRAVGKLVPVPSRHATLRDLERDLELRGVIEKSMASASLPRPAKVPAGLAQSLLQKDRDG